MSDYGSLFAEKAIHTVQREIHSTYKRAASDLKSKLAEFMKKHEAKDKLMREKLEKNLITQSEYDSWLTGQVFIQKQWESKIDQCARIMLDANKKASQLVQDKRFGVFAENYNHQAYELEKRIGSDMGFNLYNTETVGRLIKQNPRTLPKYRIDEEKDYIWNAKKLKNAVKQGIIQGEGVDQITDRIVNVLCTQNENKMRTFARTAVTGAQNAGRQQQMEDAEDLGIKLKKRWLATLDDRTRDTHQELDGQEVPVDEPFTVEVDGKKEEIEYPGDPHAEPCLVYNCRCTMIQVYEGIERKSVRRDMDDNMVENMTYKEWKKMKSK